MRTYPLDKVRADGWLEQLGEGSQGFSQLCDVVGRRFVAFSVIAGIRITALTVDPRNPSASVVEFTIGDLVRPQRLRLSEFRDRLSAAMLADDEEPMGEGSLGASPSAETLQTFLGFRYVLLAPLFGIGLEALRVGGEDPMVTVTADGEREEVPLFELRERIRLGIQDERAQHGNASPFAIDLNAVPAAQEAAKRGDHARVAELLGSWPNPLSLLLRTAEGQGLAPDVRATLAESLGMLGSAHVHLGRPEWAQEILRLAIQWGQDQLEVSAVLFRRLGAAYVAEGRHGEAIGIYRRSIALGAPRAEVLPELAQSFLARGRKVAALLCAEEALAVGAEPKAVEEVRRAALSQLGEPWDRFRARVRR